MIWAVVLAAGRSRRMGRPKALLPTGSGTFLEQILENISRSRAAGSLVVLGEDAARVRAAVRLADERVVLNPDPDAAMLSSIRCAIGAVADECAGILLWPVDHPLVETETVDALVDALREGALIALPTHEGRRGHPVGFSRRVFRELLDAPDSEGARTVVHAHLDEVREIPSADSGVVTDIDTPEIYARVFGRPLP